MQWRRRQAPRPSTPGPYTQPVTWSRSCGWFMSWLLTFWFIFYMPLLHAVTQAPLRPPPLYTASWSHLDVSGWFNVFPFWFKIMLTPLFPLKRKKSRANWIDIVSAWWSDRTALGRLHMASWFHRSGCFELSNKGANWIVIYILFVDRYRPLLQIPLHRVISIDLRIVAHFLITINVRIYRFLDF